MAPTEDFGESSIFGDVSFLDELSSVVLGANGSVLSSRGSGPTKQHSSFTSMSSSSSLLSAVSSSLKSGLRKQQMNTDLAPNDSKLAVKRRSTKSKDTGKRTSIKSDSGSKTADNDAKNESSQREKVYKKYSAILSMCKPSNLAAAAMMIGKTAAKMGQTIILWTLISFLDYHLETNQLKMCFALAFLIGEFVIDFTWANMKQYIGSVLYFTACAPVCVMIYTQFPSFHLPFLVLALGMTYVHMLSLIAFDDLLPAMVLATWLVCADVVASHKLQYHIYDGDFFMACVLITTISYTFIASNFPKVVEFRNYHIILSHARQVYSDIRMLPSIVRLLKHTHEQQCSQKRSGILSGSSRHSKQNLAMASRTRQRWSLMDFLERICTDKEPSTSLLQYEQNSMSDSQFFVQLKPSMIQCENESQLESRFECCVERVDHNKVVLSWSTPRSLLVTLADKSDLKARSSMQMQLFDQHFMSLKKDGSFLEQREDELLNQHGNARRYFTEIEGHYTLKSNEIRVLVNGVFHEHLDMKMDRKSVAVCELQPGCTYSLQMFIREYASIPVHVTTMEQEVPSLEQLSQKDREEFQKSWNRRSELISAIDDERQRKKDLQLVLKKLKKDHARLLTQAKQEADAAKKLVQRDENAHQKAVQRCATLKDTVKALSKQLDVLNEELRKCIHEVQQQRQRLQHGGVTTEHDQQQQRLQTAQDRLQSQSQKHGAMLKQLQQSLQERSRDAQLLQQELDAVDGDKKLNIMKLSEFDEVMKSLKRHRMLLEKELAKQEQQSTTLGEVEYESSVAHLQEELDMLREERDQLRLQFSRLTETA